METGSSSVLPAATATLTGPTPILPGSTQPEWTPSEARGMVRRLAGSPLALFPIALGAGTFGWSVDDRGAAELIDQFVDLGGNFVDATGPHPDGRSESAIGGWLARSGARSRILLGTTIGHQHDRSPSTTVVHAVEAALSRLRTDYLDVLSVRLPEDSPIGEVLVAVDEVVRSGKARFVAAAAPTANALIEARVVAGQSGVFPLVAVQANYSLMNRAGFESEVASVVALQECGFLPRQPLAGGLLVPENHAKQEAGRRKRQGAMASLPAKRRQAVLAALAGFGSELELEVPTVALAWLLSRPSVTAPIVSVSSSRQLAEAMAAVSVQLTRQQAAELDRLSS